MANEPNKRIPDRPSASAEMEQQPIQRRLLQGNDTIAEVLQQAVEEEAALNASRESAGWRLVEHRLAGPQGGRLGGSRRRLVPAAAVCLVALLLVLVSRRELESARSVPSAQAPASKVAALAEGATPLQDGSVVVVLPHSRAELSESSLGSRIDLDQGSVAVHASKQPPGKTLTVASGGYLFRVVGTRFTVTASVNGLPRLRVDSGRVEVLHGAQHEAFVGAGKQWPPTEPAHEHEPAPTAASSTSAVRPPRSPSSAPSQPDCLSAARNGRPREAEHCFAERALGDGIEAQYALYELARLRRDALGDASGALRAFREYQRRFPDGAFGAEVGISVAELLVRIGRYSEAIRQLDLLLQSPSGRERHDELSLLRAQSYQKLGRWSQAAAEYLQLERVGGAIGARARRERARCLQALAADGR